MLSVLCKGQGTESSSHFNQFCQMVGKNWNCSGHFLERFQSETGFLASWWTHRLVPTWERKTKVFACLTTWLYCEAVVAGEKMVIKEQQQILTKVSLLCALESTLNIRHKKWDCSTVFYLFKKFSFWRRCEQTISNKLGNARAWGSCCWRVTGNRGSQARCPV